MVMVFCPLCRKRIQTSRFNTDTVHECASGDPVLDNEDILVLGDWENFSESGRANKQEVMMAGIQNEFQGTDAALLGADFEGVTDRGNRLFTHRTRKRFVYTDFTKFR